MTYAGIAAIDDAVPAYLILYGVVTLLLLAVTIVFVALALLSIAYVAIVMLCSVALAILSSFSCRDDALYWAIDLSQCHYFATQIG
jgi:hypothetical protein